MFRDDMTKHDTVLENGTVIRTVDSMPDNQITMIGYYDQRGNFVKHNLTGPAYIKTVKYIHFGDPDREDELYNSVENWYKDGVLHRDSGPAITYRRVGNKKTRDVYYQEGVGHNLHGPAVIDYGFTEEDPPRYYYMVDGEMIDNNAVEEFLERWGLDCLADMDDGAKTAFLIEVVT